MAKELTPQEIKDIRAKYGLSQKSFARILGLGEASVARYEAGQTPSKANANLIRAAKMPRFMLDCLRRDGDVLTDKERDKVSKIVYTEVYFGEGEDDMDMTQMYEITLSQEILSEKAWGELARIERERREAEKQGDAMRVMMYDDIGDQIALLAGEITTREYDSKSGVAEITGRLNGLMKLFDYNRSKAA